MVSGLGLAAVTAGAPVTASIAGAASAVTAGATTATAAATAGGAAMAGAGAATTISGAEMGILIPAGPAFGLLGTAGIAIGSGLILLGANADDTGEYKWDCWKQVIHKTESNSTKGMPLHDVLEHPSVISVTAPDRDDLDSFVITNEWSEQFKVFYVMLPDGQIAAHAHKL